MSTLTSTPVPSYLLSQDIDLIADAYREQMGERLAKLKGAKLIASWTGFCESFLARRGRP